MASTNYNKELEKALETLKEGGIILYPTDTIWGIGCDATRADAVEKIYRLKGRDAGKPLIILLENENQLASYVQEIPEVAYDLIEFSESPLTIIYDQGKNLAENVLPPNKSIGIRVTRHPFCRDLLRRFRKPIVSTSANLSGMPPALNFGEISEAIKEGVDYVVQVEQEKESTHKPSTIIRLGASGEFSFIRK